MYLLQEILHFGTGRNSEAIKRLNWIHSLMQPNPGFVAAQICSYLGNSSRHLILRMWEDKDAFTTFRATPDGQGYAKNRPEGIYEGQPVGREWEDIIDTPGTAKGNFLIRGVFDITEGRWDDYTALRKGQDEVHKEMGGLQYSRNFKQLDEENSALMLIRKTSREDHLKYMESHLLANLRTTGPTGTFTAKGNEYYEIIDEVTK
jgi:heme-degrading monooxygenase HmoA